MTCNVGILVYPSFEVHDVPAYPTYVDLDTGDLSSQDLDHKSIGFSMRTENYNKYYESDYIPIAVGHGITQGYLSLSMSYRNVYGDYEDRNHDVPITVKSGTKSTYTLEVYYPK